MFFDLYPYQKYPLGHLYTFAKFDYLPQKFFLLYHLLTISDKYQLGPVLDIFLVNFQ